MLRPIRTVTVIGPIVWLLSVPPVSAQTTPPTFPAPDKGDKSEKSIVVNPTDDECRKGWSADLKWTKEQFEVYCERLRTSK